MEIKRLREEYHRAICARLIFRDGHGKPSLSDKSSPTSLAIAQALMERLPYPLQQEKVTGQAAGRLFERITKEFIEKAFLLLHHLRPGKWIFAVENHRITNFDQYQHLADIQRILKENPQLASALGGDYLVTPDIIIGRHPVSDATINEHGQLVDADAPLARLTPLRATNAHPQPVLHASISCKWTIRSDRAQNTRAEALNLIRNRKGHTPHIVVVTAEPLPTRLASLALGTGDLDCVYHFALPELEEAVAETGRDDQLEMLEGMVQGKRLRDISDLPFDLAI